MNFADLLRTASSVALAAPLMSVEIALDKVSSPSVLGGTGRRSSCGAGLSYTTDLENVLAPKVNRHVVFQAGEVLVHQVFGLIAIFETCSRQF